MEGKAAGLRAVAYPVLTFTVPALWWLSWRQRASFPWVVDLLVTVTCFTDILGNRSDLYDSIVWFDDWMHLMKHRAPRGGGDPAHQAQKLDPRCHYGEGPCLRRDGSARLGDR